MRAVRFVDVPISEDRDIILEANQRIIGLAITNQGSVDITLAMGGQNAFKVLEPGSSTSYGDINGGSDIFYLTGNLKIESTDWANSGVVLTYTYDVTDQMENDC